MKKLIWTSAVAAACLTILPAHAQLTPPPPAPSAAAADPAAAAELKAAREKLAADYKADRAACDAMKGNAKDVCVEEAKGKDKIARAELDQKMQPSDSNARKVSEAKVDAAYNIAKEKCDDQKGAEKKACVKEAKAEQARGKAEIKTTQKK